MRLSWSSWKKGGCGDKARPHPEGRARSCGDKAVIRVRQRRNNTRDARFAGCLTLSGRQGWEWSVAVGQWPVVSGQWSVWPLVGGERGWGKTVRSNPVKPSQTNQTGWRRRLKAEGLMIKDESRKNQVMSQPDSQTQSGPVKPAGAAWGGGFYNGERRRSYCGCVTFGPSRRYILVGRESSRIKANQTSCGNGQRSEVRGQRSVDSGQWLVAKEGGGSGEVASV
jgi:hypothetical protein